MIANYREVTTSIDLNGRSSFIRHIELEHEPGGKLVVFIPGIGGFAESYLGNLDAVYTAGFWPMAVDNLGFGGSDKPETEELSLTLFSEALIKWLATMEYESLYIVGNSFGCGVGMGMYEFIGERIDGMILVSPSGFAHNLWLPYRFASLPLVNYLVVRLVINKYLGNRGARSWNTIVHDPYTIPDEIVTAGENYKRDHRIRNAYSYILKNFVGYKGQKDVVIDLIHRLGNKLKEDHTPTLIIWGKSDVIIPPTHAEIAREVTGGEVVFFDDCGHMAYVEHIDAFNETLVQFLNGK